MEAFSFLDSLNVLPGVRAGWIERIPDLPIAVDRDTAMQVLKPHHRAAIHRFAGESASWARAEQVHGSFVAKVPGAATSIASDGLPMIPLADGLITCETGIVLTIYVADCGPIWLADSKSGAIGLLHSGRKGTEENILMSALQQMKIHFGTAARDVVIVLGPCIRPPNYEFNFAATIEQQAIEAGVSNYTDCRQDTSGDLRRYYSYRRELGKTGRMMALLMKYPTK